MPRRCPGCARAESDHDDGHVLRQECPAAEKDAPAFRRRSTALHALRGGHTSPVGQIYCSTIRCCESRLRSSPSSRLWDTGHDPGRNLIYAHLIGPPRARPRGPIVAGPGTAVWLVAKTFWRALPEVYRTCPEREVPAAAMFRQFAYRGRSPATSPRRRRGDSRGSELGYSLAHAFARPLKIRAVGARDRRREPRTERGLPRHSTFLNARATRGAADLPSPGKDAKTAMLARIPDCTSGAVLIQDTVYEPHSCRARSRRRCTSSWRGALDRVAARFEVQRAAREDA